MTDQSQPSEKPFLFRVSNHHSPSCGVAPTIDGDAPGRYYGYYENELREQLVFVYDRQTQTGTLWMGDVGWEEPHPVMDGEAPDLVLSLEEAIWLQLCWYGATGEMPSKMKQAVKPPTT